MSIGAIAIICNTVITITTLVIISKLNDRNDE